MPELNERVRVLLVEDNPIDAALLERAAGDVDGCTILMEHVVSRSAAIERLGCEIYDVVLLDLMLPDSQGLETVVTVRDAAAGAAVVVLTGIEDESLAVRAVQCGAQDYLVKGRLAPSEVFRATRSAILSFALSGAKPANVPAGAGRIAAFTAAKGGTGTTVVACHAARQLAARGAGRVLLLDLDVASGAVGFVTRMKPQYSVVDAVANLDRLDASFFKALVSTTADGLDVLAFPPDTPAAAEIGADALGRLFRFLTQQYDWVVVDLGRWSRDREAFFSELGIILFVAAPDLIGLYRAKRVVGDLLNRSVSPSSLGLVLNRVPKRADLEADEIESLLGIQVYGTIPEAAGEISEALASAAFSTPGCGFAAAIAALVARTAGFKEPVATRRRRFALPFL